MFTMVAVNRISHTGAPAAISGSEASCALPAYTNALIASAAPTSRPMRTVATPVTSAQAPVAISAGTTERIPSTNAARRTCASATGRPNNAVSRLASNIARRNSKRAASGIESTQRSRRCADVDVRSGRLDLVRRPDGALARRYHPCADPFASLRSVGVRGPAGLQDTRGPGHFPAARAHGAPLQFGAHLPDADTVHAGAADGSAAPGGQGEQTGGVLSAPDRLLRLREDGRESERGERARGGGGLAVGRVSGRGRAARGDTREDVLLCAPPYQRVDGPVQDGRSLRELDPGQPGGHARRLRRGVAAGHAGFRGRGRRGKPVHRTWRADIRTAARILQIGRASCRERV